MRIHGGGGSHNYLFMGEKFRKNLQKKENNLEESSEIHPYCRREAPMNLKPPFPLTGGGNIENMGSLRSGDGFGGLWRVVVNPRKPLLIRYYGGGEQQGYETEWCHRSAASASSRLCWPGEERVGRSRCWAGLRRGGTSPSHTMGKNTS